MFVTPSYAVVTSTVLCHALLRRAVPRCACDSAADYGCTHALRRGHGLSVFDRLGSGKAASISKGCLSAAAGFFVGGGCAAAARSYTERKHATCNMPAI